VHDAIDVGRDNQDSTDMFADPTLLENLHVNHVSFDCGIFSKYFLFRSSLEISCILLASLTVGND